MNHDEKQIFYNRLFDAIDKIDEKLDKQNETLIRNTASLEEHIRRTNLLEKKVGDVEVTVDRIKTHVDKVSKWTPNPKNLKKALIGMGAICASIMTILKFLHYI